MKKLTRHQMRESVFCLLFEASFSKEDVDAILETAKDSEIIPVDSAVEGMFRGVLLHQQEIDGIIQEHLVKWTMERISKVSLAILRMGVYEIYYTDDVENDIVVSECVKLTSSFAYEDDISFVNGVLGSIVRSL